MFWGLIMEPGRCYTQKVKLSFHVSMASLDNSNSTDDPTQVMCVYEGRNYLLCTLKKKDIIQCPLNLNFLAGSKVSFATNGKAHVHLTGYLTEFANEQVDEEAEEEEIEEKQEKKRVKKQLNEGPPTKKNKLLKNSVTISKVEEEEEESSDSDFVAEEESDEEEEGEEGEEEEGEAEEEEDSSLTDESEDTQQEGTEEVKPKQNGIAKTQENKNKDQKNREKPDKEKAKKENIQKPKKIVLKGGIIVQELKEGAGEIAKEGKFVHVYYEGRLQSNNKVFDSTVAGPGFKFRLGKGEVIKGWDIGLVGMKAGGLRRITCPPKVAYGAKGSPPVIPPNATLVFDVQLKKIS